MMKKRIQEIREHIYQFKDMMTREPAEGSMLRRVCTIAIKDIQELLDIVEPPEEIIHESSQAMEERLKNEAAKPAAATVEGSKPE